VTQFAFLAAIWSLSANAQKLPHDLTAATLEELMNFEVTSVRRADLPEELDARRDTDWKMTHDGFCADWNLSTPGFQVCLFRESAGLGLKIPILTAPFHVCLRRAFRSLTCRSPFLREGYMALRVVVAMEAFGSDTTSLGRRWPSGA